MSQNQRVLFHDENNLLVLFGEESSDESTPESLFVVEWLENMFIQYFYISVD